MDALSTAPTLRYYDPQRGGWLREALGRVDFFVVLVLALPFATFTFYNAWIITPPGWLDPWYSFGCFMDFETSLRHASGWYGATRLAYWLPGYLVHQLFPPLVANHVLRLAFYLLATLSLYMAVKRTLGRQTALIAVLCMGLYWHFLSQVGWAYVDGAGVAYLLAACAGVVYADGSPQRRLCLFVAGLFFAAAIHTNVFLASAGVPLFVLHAGASWSSGQQRKLLGDSLVVLAALVSLTLAFGIFFYYLTGQVLMAASLRVVLNALANPNRSTKDDLGFEVPSIYHWIRWSLWLHVPIVVLATSVILLIRSCIRRDDVNRWAVIFQFAFISHCGFMVLCQLLKMSVLVVSWYTVYIVPLLFLALAGQMGRLVEAMRPRSVLLLFGSGLAITAALFWVHPYWPAMVEWLKPRAQWAQMGYMMGSMLLFLAAVVVIRKERRILAGAALVLSLAAMAVMNYSRAAEHIGAYPLRAKSFNAVMDAVAVLKQHGCDIRNIQFWYQNKNPDYADTALFHSVHSYYLWGYTRYGYDFPKVPRDGQGSVEPPRAPVIVLLSKTPGAYAEASKSLREINYDSTLLHEQEIRRDDVYFRMTLVGVSPQSVARASP